jgi:hypothetical protein
MPHRHSRYLSRQWSLVPSVYVGLGLLMLPLFSGYVWGQGPTWKVFSNRAGWSIDYPNDWTIGSCRSCKDPTAPNVFVDFFPPSDRDSGWVIIEHLADKPSGMSVEAWFTDVKQTANLSPRLKEEKLIVHGLPALSVRYRNPKNRGEEMEVVYLVSGFQTFSIEFDGEKPGLPLEKFGNYNTFLRMVKSFRGKA